MKKILTATALILLIGGFALGGMGIYIYFSSRQDCAQAVARAEDINRAGTAATATAEQKKDAEYALKGAVMICENSRERRTNALLFGAGAFVAIFIAAALFFFSRQMRRRIR